MTSPRLIDAHTHIQIDQFDNDRTEVIGRALERGIWLINAGDNKKSSQDAVGIANDYKNGVYATIGQHPSEKENFDVEFYKGLAKNKKAVAIGECGLDYYYKQSDADQAWISADKERQKKLFAEQIILAKETGLPLMIHCRDAFSDLIEILKKYHQGPGTESLKGIVHFFTGDKIIAEKFLDMGFNFTFGGLVTFNRSFDDVIKYIPLENILIETDAPYVAPVPYRGKRNEPLYVEEVAKAIAGVKGIPPDDFCAKATENTRKIFNI